ncbi:cobalamin-dependent protein [Hymenobacter sp. BT770]|uniref:cobalamin B12-binding domain-containing protein n=1 Tax=Hymenobacter sp. BT770 TaxID=2886942 RepID=UPI001D0FDC74|nr:cobalamin-dependent protein [Hymenobacter sp. BT770]MCC3153980.1 cobalamin-dependent protein [Hymenobacter sp. BT770]MDO3416090.1 cobalamin-dependent protein [Hymenobacter sp. BT770]
MPTNQALREQIAQRLNQELEALASYAAKQLTLPAGPDAGSTLAQLKQHLLALGNAVLMNSPALFEAHALQLSQEVGAPHAIEQVAALRQALLLRLSVGEYVVAASTLSAGVNALASKEVAEEPIAAPAPERIPEAGRFAGLSADYLSLLLAADRTAAQRLVLAEAEAGTDVRHLYLHVLQPAQREVGNLWHSGTISVAEEHYCTAATAGLMAQLQPYFQQTPRNGRRLLAACVAGDLHTLGLQMVADFLEYDGWEVSYLGASTPLDSIRRMVAEQGVDLLLTAASMPHHVPLLRELVAGLRSDRATQHVRVLVGGRPFAHDAALWERTGADAWAANADEAVTVVRGMFEDGKRDADVKASQAAS